MNGKQEFLDIIQSNIDQYGYHLTIVKSAIEPRYAYTIGLTSLLKYELIFAGGVYYLKDELFQIFNGVVNELKKDSTINNRRIAVGSLGTFSLSSVKPSWSQLMMLGVKDYYSNNDIQAFQIMPDADHYTLDIPNMTQEFRTDSQPVWQWLVRAWDYSVPENSTVTTNIEALLGQPITEIMRWEDDEWEMFVGDGSEVDEEDIRVVSLGTILGIDSSLIPATKVEVGKGLWREQGNSNWNPWG